jgi:hypothetical protein
MTVGLPLAKYAHATTLSDPSAQLSGPALPSTAKESCREHSLTTGGIVAGARTARVPDRTPVGDEVAVGAEAEDGADVGVCVETVDLAAVLATTPEGFDLPPPETA